MTDILELLSLTPSDESRDFVANKRQFHLHELLTEQRHPRTWDLGFRVQHDVEGALRQILSVDEDIERRLAELARDPAPLQRAADAVATALRERRRVYVYGCGATGRLAKQVESTFWRPFWRRVQVRPEWQRLRAVVGDDVGERLVGEMTGGDRALVSSLEGFEDLQLLGALQLADHGIARGDVVLCITEGGETSSVIGTILAAVAQYAERGALDAAARAAARERLFFVYNNPAAVLRPFERSRAVLDEPGITKIELATGPQAISGSTRMQATTIETFVVAVILEQALQQVLGELLDGAALSALGFARRRGIAERLSEFTAVRASVARAVPALAELTRREAATCAANGVATYFAGRSLVTVFTDCTERSPTFRLHPLDRVDVPERRCQVRVWTEAEDSRAAWQALLGRRFRGLAARHYRAPLEAGVQDPYLRRAALDSLQRAGDDQEACYDFSFSPQNLARAPVREGDLGVLVLVGDECAALARSDSAAHRLLQHWRQSGASVCTIAVGASAVTPAGVDVALAVDVADDPLDARRQLALKILLNAHSTAMMARLGRVVGNTMTNVSPSNLKLVGRATFLIRSHVDDVLRQPEWIAAHGATEPLSFAAANAVLFDAIGWVRAQGLAQTSEVALSIVRIVEALRRGVAVDHADALRVVEGEGLASFLARHNPALRAGR